MRIFILDIQSESLEQMLVWLSESEKVSGVEVFFDYIQFVEKVESLPPDICIIRLGYDGIPGIKIADIVRCISSEIRIIFVSDARDYAIDAYEVGASGYLLCPMDRRKFERCLLSGSYEGSLFQKTEFKQQTY